MRPTSPLACLQAARLGNVSALVVRARLLDAGGCPDEAMRCWRRAAKAGHLEGQLLYGLALYRGTAGVAPDAEDAHLWLSRALKQVSQQEGWPRAAGRSVAGHGVQYACTAGLQLQQARSPCAHHAPS